MQKPGTVKDRRTFKAGDVIFRKGDVGGPAYLIESGVVEILLEGSPGVPERILDRKRANEIFGEMALVDGQPRSATARAKEAVICSIISQQTLAAQLEQTPPAVRGLVRILINRVRKTNEALEQANLPPAVRKTFDEDSPDFG